MIARSWRGAVKTAGRRGLRRLHRRDRDAASTRDTPGNRGAWMLTRERRRADRVRHVLACGTRSTPIKAFAGEDYDRPRVFYPEDDRYLVERDTDLHTTGTWSAPPG